jgi:hypothetical protein
MLHTYFVITIYYYNLGKSREFQNLKKQQYHYLNVTINKDKGNQLVKTIKLTLEKPSRT